MLLHKAHTPHVACYQQHYTPGRHQMLVTRRVSSSRFHDLDDVMKLQLVSPTLPTKVKNTWLGPFQDSRLHRQREPTYLRLLSSAFPLRYANHVPSVHMYRSIF